MSGIQAREVVLRIRPGESETDFARRVAATAPPTPTHVMDRLRALLAPTASAADSGPPRRNLRHAA